MSPQKKAPTLVSAVTPKNTKTASSAVATPKNGSSSATPATPSPTAQSSAQRAVPSRPRKTPKGDEELKREALKSNPHGVHIYSTNLENSKAVMAGYLKLSDTNALSALLAREDNANLLLAFVACRKTGFGILDRSETSTWSSKSIFETISSASRSEEALYDSADIPIRHDQLPGMNIRSTAPGYLTWINVMHRLIVGNPESFPNDTAVSTLLGPHTAEDWFRAYSLIRYHHRSTTQAPKGAARGPMNLTAEAPKFLVDADFRASASAGLDAPTAEDEESPSESENDEEVELDEAALEQIEGEYDEGALAMSAGGDLNKATKDCGRPPLTRGQVGHFLAQHGDKANILYNLCRTPQDQRSMAVSAAAEAANSLTEVERNDQENTQMSAERKEFWKLMGAVSAVSVETQPYLECCDALGIDPAVPMIGDSGHKYQPWQIIGIQKMLQMENSVLRGGINACDCGTGKTVTCLGLIEQAAIAAATSTEPNVYKPTLVVCPSQLIDVWHDDYKKFFSGPGRLILKQFYGSLTTITNPSRKATLMGTKLNDLTKYLGSLDPADPATARVVIVSAYSTWHRRTLMATEAEANEQEEPDAKEEPKDEYDPDDEDEMAAANPTMIYTSLLKECFDRVVCDEAHALKNEGTLTHLAVKHVEAPKMWFISATPMINHVRDLRGYLSLLWKDEWRLLEDLDLKEFYGDDSAAVDFLDFEDESRADLITAVTKGQNIYRLNPQVYRAVAGAETPDTQLVGLALRAILSQIQMRHTMATQIDLGNGQTVRIGEDIPHYLVRTVELRMSKAQTRAYETVYNQHVSTLYTGKGPGDGALPAAREGSGGGRLNLASHRRLVHATLNTHLETLVVNVGKKSLVSHINKWYEKGKDYGVTHFFKKARPAPYLRPYNDRLAMAEFMVGLSPKMQYMCGLLNDLCIKKKERVQIVVDMPMNQWTIEAFLVNLGLNVRSLRSAHSQADRRDTIKAFNDPLSAVDVLVTSFRTSSLGVNLQFCCFNTLILDTPRTVPLTLQIIGRIHRMGQKHVQHIYIITVDHTYDQVLQARATNKMIAQLAGESRLEGDTEEALNASAATLITKMLGQRCSRAEWGDLDLRAKDKLKQRGFATEEQERKGKADRREQRARLKSGVISGRTRATQKTIASLVEDEMDADTPATTRPVSQAGDVSMADALLEVETPKAKAGDADLDEHASDDKDDPVDDPDSSDLSDLDSSFPVVKNTNVEADISSPVGHVVDEGIRDPPQGKPRKPLPDIPTSEDGQGAACGSGVVAESTTAKHGTRSKAGGRASSKDVARAMTDDDASASDSTSKTPTKAQWGKKRHEPPTESEATPKRKRTQQKGPVDYSDSLGDTLDGSFDHILNNFLDGDEDN